jgi:hypothetical protein
MKYDTKVKSKTKNWNMLEKIAYLNSLHQTDIQTRSEPFTPLGSLNATRSFLYEPQKQSKISGTEKTTFIIIFLPSVLSDPGGYSILMPDSLG